MNEPTVRLLIRIPASLKTKLAELAEREHRSLNRQIEFMLDRSIREKTANEANHSHRSRIEGRKRYVKYYRCMYIPMTYPLMLCCGVESSPRAPRVQEP